MIRPFAVALATGALCAALLAAGHAGAQEEGKGAPEHGFALPRCSEGEAMPEADLLAMLDRGGFRLESAHGRSDGGTELTYAAHGGLNPGRWVRLLADGATACAIAAGRDEETTA